MIRVQFRIISGGEIVGFSVDSHGDKIVCAAVSALTINTINSIEWLAHTDFSCECENERFIDFYLTDEADANARLLLESLRLGLRAIADEYPKDLIIEEISVSVKRGAL